MSLIIKINDIFTDLDGRVYLKYDSIDDVASTSRKRQIEFKDYRAFMSWANRISSLDEMDLLKIQISNWKSQDLTLSNTALIVNKAIGINSSNLTVITVAPIVISSI